MNTRTKIMTCGIAICAMGIQTTHAQPINVVNPGFEDPELFDDEFVSAHDGSVPGWVASGAWYAGGWNVPAATYTNEAPEGLNVGWSWATLDDPGIEVNLTQTLSETVEAGATYTLTVHVGNAAAYFSDFNNWDYEFDGFPGYRVELLAGGQVIAVDDSSLLPDEGTFEETSISYTVADDDEFIGQPLGIRLVNPNDGRPGQETDFDNVRLSKETGCPADLDGDGDADADDFFAYLDAFAAGALDVCDIDGDGDCDADDFFGYLDRFAQGC